MDASGWLAKRRTETVMTYVVAVGTTIEFTVKKAEATRFPSEAQAIACFEGFEASERWRWSTEWVLN